MKCWGSDWLVGDMDHGLEFVSPSQISAGLQGWCAIDLGKLVCSGRIGLPETQTGDVVLVDIGGGNVGGNHGCFLDEFGTAACWSGYLHPQDKFGQLEVPTLVNPVSVASGGYHSCALHDEGVTCWGRNDFGQSGAVSLDTRFGLIVIDPDQDGFNNQGGADAFPLDPAASIDSDGDGKPDEWNPGKTQADSTSTLN